MFSRLRPVVFVMTGMYNFTGGMGSLNRLVLMALLELVEEHGFPLRVLSYIESDKDRPPFLPEGVPFEPFYHVKKNLFKREVALALTERPLFVCDHVSLAFPLFPFAAVRWVKTVIYAHQAEAWGDIQPSSRWSFQFSSLVLTHSQWALARMRAKHFKGYGVTCPPGLMPEHELNETIPPPSDEEIVLRAVDGELRPLGERVLLMVARTSRQELEKGHIPAIRVMPLLRSEFPDAQLVIAGPGDGIEPFSELARSLGVADKVFFTGFVSVEMMRKLYRHCYLYVMPNPLEGFGLVYLEAMNFGKACVGCWIDGDHPVIVHGETGILVRDPTDTAELAQALSELLSNPDRAAQLGAAGFARLHANFTSAQFRARFRQHIESLL